MNNIEHDYLKLLNDIMVNGVTKSDRTGTGTISVFGRQIRHDMSLGFPLLTTKKMPFKTIVTELLWFLKGDTNIKYLVDNDVHIWDGDAYKNYEKTVKLSIDKATDEGILKDSTDYNILSKEGFIDRIKNDNEFAKKWGELGPIYGKQWRSWGKDFKQIPNEIGDKVYHITTTGIDQIANLINDLKTNPDSRRLMVSAWNVGELDQMVLPPCHYGFQLYTRELSLEERIALVKPIPNLFSHEDCDVINLPKRAISLMWNQRSVDTPLGLPFNIASYALLLELLAMEVNMVPDELIGNLGDCHIYLDQVDGVKEQLWRQPLLLGRLVINNEFWNPDGNVFDQQDIRPEDFRVEGYESHPTIKFPLSN
jgi:thymidylate synthase